MVAVIMRLPRRGVAVFNTVRVRLFAAHSLAHSFTDSSQSSRTEKQYFIMLSHEQHSCMGSIDLCKLTAGADLTFMAKEPLRYTTANQKGRPSLLSLQEWHNCCCDSWWCTLHVFVHPF